jgi:hypothetical protein
MKISGEFHSPTALLPGKNPPVTTEKEAGGGFTLGLRRLKKKEENIILCRESNKYSSDDQSVATYYTDCAIQAAGFWVSRKNFKLCTKLLFFANRKTRGQCHPTKKISVQCAISYAYLDPVQEVQIMVTKKLASLITCLL